MWYALAYMEGGGGSHAYTGKKRGWISAAANSESRRSAQQAACNMQLATYNTPTCNAHEATTRAGGTTAQEPQPVVVRRETQRSDRAHIAHQQRLAYADPCVCVRSQQSHTGRLSAHADAAPALPCATVPVRAALPICPYGYW